MDTVNANGNPKGGIMNQAEAEKNFQRAKEAREQIDAITLRISDLQEQIKLEKKSLAYWTVQLTEAGGR